MLRFEDCLRITGAMLGVTVLVQGCGLVVGDDATGVSANRPAPGVMGAVDSGASVLSEGGGHPEADRPEAGLMGARDMGSDFDDAPWRHGRCIGDSDCPGGHCVTLSGGFRVCSYPTPPPQTCTDSGSGSPFPDECCGSCPQGRCTLQTSCGGPFINPHNVCAVDECQADSDCGAMGVCLPLGVGDVARRVCLQGNECTKDSDCTHGQWGACVLPETIGPADQCAPFSCDSIPLYPVVPMRCIYESDGCSSDRNCTSTQHCEDVGGTLQCQPGTRTVCPPPP